MAWRYLSAEPATHSGCWVRMSDPSRNRDPESVQRANGRLIVGGVIFGLIFVVCAFAVLLTVGVPFGAHDDQQAPPAAANQGQHATAPAAQPPAQGQPAPQPR